MRTLLVLLSKQKLKIVFALFWGALFLSGLFHHAGSKFVFTIFSIVSLAMLLSGIYRRASYGYLFLVIFLWLGFWFKLTANFLILGHFPFGEPVGNFNSSMAAWDEVLWIASGANVGVLCGGFLYGLFPVGRAVSARAKAPTWYRPVRRWLWATALAITLGVAAVNIYLGIHQIGITPRTVLPWPLNSLIAWMLNFGSAMLLAVLTWWDMAEDQKIRPQLYAMLGEAFSSTVSVISRATFPFHVIPQLVALGSRKAAMQRYSKMQLFQFCIAFGALFSISIALVSFMRDYQYAGSKAIPLPGSKLESKAVMNTSQLPATAVPAPPVEKISSFRWILIHQLLVNRWIGIEGVMAVSSYPGKGTPLFIKLLMEKRGVGKVGMYQEISNSGYQTADPKYQFASLPGAVAFFFCSGSLVVVVLGMAAMALLVMVAEKGIFVLTENPLLCSLFGMTAANTVAQFGVAPRQDAPYFLMIFLAAILVYCLQTGRLASVLAQLHATPESSN